MKNDLLTIIVKKYPINSPLRRKDINKTSKILNYKNYYEEETKGDDANRLFFKAVVRKMIIDIIEVMINE